MKQTILILGGKGMLGQEIAHAYHDTEKYDVISWDRDDIDVTQTDELRTKINNLWPDVIYNAVAYNAVDACEKDDTEYDMAKKLNVTFPGELARIAKNLNATLVHYSSDYVFDGEKPVYDSDSGRSPGCCGGNCTGCMYLGNTDSMAYFVYQEGDKTHPLSKYGETKRDGEIAVAKNAGPSYYIIRLSKLFGKPATSTAGKKAFFDVMLTKGKEAQKTGDVIKAVDGEMSKFTYAPDLAQESKKIVEEECERGIYHVVNEGECTWYQGVKELYNIAELGDVVVEPVPPETFPRPAKRPPSSVLRTTKRTPLRHYTDALTEYIKSGTM